MNTRSKYYAGKRSYISKQRSLCCKLQRNLWVKVELSSRSRVITELITTGVPMSKKGELLMIMAEYGKLGLF